jgi:hypothetical protein
VTVSRADRRRDREARVNAIFGPKEASAALDLLEIVELAWHDSNGEISPPEDLIDDMLLLSGGNLDDLIFAARLALTDWRDVRVNADACRNPA